MGAVTVLSSPIVPHRPATFLHNSAVCSFMMSATAGELPGSHCLTPVSCCNWRVEISDNGLIFFSLSPTPTSEQPINNTCFMKSYLLLVENNQRQTPQEAFNSLVRYYLDQGIKPQIESLGFYGVADSETVGVGHLSGSVTRPQHGTRSSEHGPGIKTTLKTSGHREERKGHPWSSKSSGCSDDLPLRWTSSVWGENVRCVVMDLFSVLIWPL